MKAKPLISIIVPCYNYGHLVHETLNSVIAQTHEHWECIIVDDGSTDTTGDVALGYSEKDQRFKYIYQNNRGLAAARNTGLKVAVGEYIQFLDADDLLKAEKIERQLAVLAGNSEVDLVYGRVYVFDKYFSEIHKAREIVMQPKVSGSGETILDRLVEDNIFLVHCALFRSSIIKKLGLFKEDMITCEDWNFWFRMALEGNYFYFLDDERSNVYVRDHGNNMSRNRKNMWLGRIMFHQEVERLANRSPFQTIRKRNHELLLTLQKRYQLAYGNMLAGVVNTFLLLLLYKNYYKNVRDTLYWIKERILFKI